MAKKSKIDKQIDSIERAVLDKYGDNVLTSGQSVVDSPSSVLPVSPGLDIILGGGIPEGSFVIVTGPPKVGKTTLCLDFASTAQKIKHACDIGRKEGRHVYYSNIEGRIKKRDLEGIHGLDISPDKLTIIQSTPGNILTAEMHIGIVLDLLNKRPGDIFIIDSLSALCTEGEMKAEIGDRYRADAPQLLARFCRRIATIVPINKSIVFGITHIIANQGNGMSPWSEASGRKVQYQTDVKLKATHCKPWVVGENQIGQDVFWVAEVNALNAPRNGKFISKLRYGYGLDKPSEIITLAVDLSMVKKGGSWYTFNVGETDETKCQGLDKAAEYLTKNTDLYDSLYKNIRIAMGLD